MRGGGLSGEAGWDLPPEGEATVAGVRLPAGRRLAAECAERTPVLWATGELGGAAAAWLTLKDRLAGTQLVPVLLSGFKWQPERPWDVGELEPCDPGAVGELDAAMLLEEMWRSAIPKPEEDEAVTAKLLAPYSRAFPGLAVAVGLETTTTDVASAVTLLPSPVRLGLVAASRPADVPAIVGWTGAINYYATAAPLACVLRSWEDRFGARLLHLGFDTMDLLIERPVPSHEAALAVAAEHFAFCPDNIYQGASSISRYAAALLGAAIWSFWWD
jgi:hypothetical protein